MNARVERARALIEAPLLVTHPVDIRYLTGLESSNAALLVEPDGGIRLFTDFRYLEQARALGLEVEQLPRNLYAGLPDRLPHRVEFQAEHLVYAHWAALSEAGIELVARQGVVEGVRAVKEPTELELIRRAAAITSECFERLAEERFVGRTERELAWWLESLMRELGADGPAFPVIVAAGPSGALPHATPGERVIEPGQTVVVDAGARFHGYCSDCTRTFATGTLPDELARSYAVCLRAEQAGVEAVAPGAEGRAVDAAARRVIEAAGLDELFGHGLGHGVGLEVHEQPRLRPESEDVLAAGEVVTVEPGIYHPSLGGIRIEDLVVVGDDGPAVLTTFTKELVTVR